MTDTQLLITETKNGSSTPRSTWIANSEADFIQKVRASFPLGDGILHIDTVEDACIFQNLSLAIYTTVYTKEEFESYDPASFCKLVLDKAEHLGWYTPEEDANE